MEKIIYIILTLVLFFITLSMGFSALVSLAHLSILSGCIDALISILSWLGCKGCFKKI